MFYNAVVYAQKDGADNIKQLLSQNGIAFTEAVVGRDVIQEEVTSLFPASGGQSIVAINGQYVGNYGALREWFNTRPTFLSE